MYRFAKVLQKVLLKLPLRILFILGVIIGLVLYANNKKRRTAFRNIKLAFPEKTNTQLHAILRRSFINFGLSIVESFIASRIFKYVRLKYDAAIGQDGGILVGIHEGSWEVYNWLLAHRFNYAMFAQKQRNRGLDRLLNELRRGEGLKVCFSFKETLRYLKCGYFLAFGVDHGAEDNALYIDFFSHLVPTPKGAVYLAKKFNKKIYPGFGYRTHGFWHVLELGSPISAQEYSQEELLRNLNRVYEEFLSKHPSEYLWYYKRFKRRKSLDVVILNDGKLGHLKQSEAFLSHICEEPYRVSCKIIDVRYKNRLARVLSEVCAFLSTKACVGCGKCLRFLLKPVSLDALEKTYADMVISTGSYAAPVNKIFSSSLGAKSIAIFRPNIPLNRFDLTILPEHDRIHAPGTVKIKGALFCRKNLEKKITACKEFFNLNPDRKIAVFLGGPLYDEDGFIENTKVFIEKIKEFSLEKNYKILVSTSRRTPKIVDEYLEKNLENFKNTEIIVYAQKANYDFVFEGFVYFSEIVFVSSESISMISETLSLKKPCVCVFLERIDAKHKVFLESVESEVSFLKSPYDIKNISLKVSSLFEENRAVVKEAIKKLL